MKYTSKKKSNHIFKLNPMKTFGEVYVLNIKRGLGWTDLNVETIFNSIFVQFSGVQLNDSCEPFETEYSCY